jgi:hypothetical protein
VKRWLAAAVALAATAAHAIDTGGPPQPPNEVIAELAQRAPGSYPRSWRGEPLYWTVVGAPDGLHEALLSDEGAVEPIKGGFSIVPFLHLEGARISAKDATRSQALEQGELPIPSVQWEHPRARLRVRAFAPDDDAAWVSYRVENPQEREERVELWLTLRPMQVLPVWQFLNTPGGFAPIREIEVGAAGARVNGAAVLWPLVPPDAFGADGLDLRGAIETGVLPASTAASDWEALAAGALVWRLVLPPRAAREVHVRVALAPGVAPLATPPADPDAFVAAALAKETARWSALVGRAELALPGEAADLARTARASLGHILVNRDGPRLQPGSRNYERSWIRDGALTSSALVQLGHADAARAFLAWYAGFQLENGSLPCCVDARGADPTPEHDSTGAFLYALGEYARHTRDDRLVRELWPRVVRAVAWLERLRSERLDPRFRTEQGGATFGILPESISHEGYAKKPVHSYWDDLFARQGLRDAVFLAEMLADVDRAAAWNGLRLAFERDLLASYEATMKLHGIPHLPGSVELGDFDPTATAVGLELGGEPRGFPQAALRATFARYLGEVAERRRGVMTRDAYAPYEIRIAGALVRMGERERAHEVLTLLDAGRRPAAWRQWPEIVWTDETKGQWLGDLPHGWIGSTYLHALRTALVYERASDSALVLAAGVPAAWLAGGEPLRVARLSTAWGPLEYELRREPSGALRMRVGALPRRPPGGVVLAPPGVSPTLLRELPADVVLLEEPGR